MKSTVSTGKTLDAAVEHALKELGLARDQVEVKVLQEGGFLKSYKVEVTEIEAEVVPEETIDADEVQTAIEEVATEADNGGLGDQTNKIKAFLANVLEKMGITGVTVQAKEVGDVVALTIVGDNATMAEADYICLHDEVVDDTQPLEICDPDATWKKKVLTDFTARELLPRGKELMHTRYCLLYELGRCRKQCQNEDLQFPLFLCNDKHRFLLEFDCRKCFMKVRSDK